MPFPGQRRGGRRQPALRRHASQLLTRRRRVAGLSLGAAAAMGAVAAYQTGLVRHLPEPPLAMFDADRVDASGEAYQLGKCPRRSLKHAWRSTACVAGAERVE